MNQTVATTISTGTPRRSLDSNPDLAHTHGHPTPSSVSAAKNHVVFRHHRTNSKTASATTTISQTYEQTSQSPPPTLLKSLSGASDEDATPQSTASALAKLGPPPHARGLLLLAQMSSAGNLMTPEYTFACTNAAREHKDFVLGFVCQESLNSKDDDHFLNFTPGVGLPKEDGDGEGMKRDGKGQVWRTPAEVVGKDGVDIVIVGRGILGAEDRRKEAERYRKAAWAALLRTAPGHVSFRHQHRDTGIGRVGHTQGELMCLCKDKGTHTEVSQRCIYICKGQRNEYTHTLRQSGCVWDTQC